MKKTMAMRVGALLLALTLVCGAAAAEPSQWINSDIIGAVTQDTAVSLKDDFHTAVNLDWILNEADQRSGFERSQELINERKLDIVMGRASVDPANADAVGLSSEWLAHDLKLIQTFTSLSGEWTERNALGVEPARPYVEAIANISTMDELTAYLTNENGMNISGFSMVKFDVITDPADRMMQVVAISPTSTYSLQNQTQYLYLDNAGRSARYVVNEVTHYLLGRLGYDKKEIDKLLAMGYRFEGRMAQWSSDQSIQQTLNYLQSSKPYTLAELEKLAGRYPLAEQLRAWGLDDMEAYAVFEVNYIRRMSGLYQQKYLEEIKAACMMHTAMALIDLLDEEAYHQLVAITETVNPGYVDDIASFEGEMEETEETVSEEEQQAAFVFENYLNQYLPEPMDQIYVAAYCTPGQKKEIRDMIDQSITFYREMIQRIDWLSEEARLATVEKLDNMVIRCVYPDRFNDYTGLNFSGYRDETPGTLPQAVAAINAFQQEKTFENAGQPVDRYAWNMTGDMSTTICNAYYMPLENSINILAGILTEEMLGADPSYEQKLAVIGTIIGHEITHAFDTNGYKFDKDGLNKPWWSDRDVESFDMRADRLVKYYNALTPYPGALLYSGDLVSGEAIADMGGVKCMLSIAEDIPDFDYEAFFRAYAQIWRVQQPHEVEKAQAMNDPHPLGYLRTNVTLMQFDEFQETFDIQPGDGMYLAPENRISVW